MAIPDYQTVMLPLLKTLGNQQEYHIRQAIEKLAINFEITDEERKTTLPSGTQPLFDNRVHWAKVYLKKAGLLDNTRRGYIEISQRGLDVLKSNPSTINVAFLKKYPELFRVFEL